MKVRLDQQTCGVRDKQSKRQNQQKVYHLDEAKPICGASLDHLDRLMERTVDTQTKTLVMSKTTKPA